MKKLKIAIYAIALNERAHVERFYQSAVDADLILLADTGSTDGTPELARELGITTYDISVKPWRFDTARNIALGLVPQDYDICISVDLDELMLPGWRLLVEDAWRPGTTRLQYRFNNQGTMINATKIHSRHGYNWDNICHEMINPDPRIKEQWSVIEDILIEHKPDLSKSRSQYLPLLETATRMNPYSHRDSWYLAREYWYYKQYDACAREFARYLELPSASWHHDRSYAQRCQGKSYLALGQIDQGLAALRSATLTSPEVRDCWLDLAQACHNQNLWHECLYAGLKGLSISQREYHFTLDSEPWGYRLDDLLSLAAYHLGMRDTAIKHGELAIALNPNDQRLIDNLKYYQSM